MGGVKRALIERLEAEQEARRLDEQVKKIPLLEWRVDRDFTDWEREMIWEYAVSTRSRHCLDNMLEILTGTLADIEGTAPYVAPEDSPRLLIKVVYEEPIHPKTKERLSSIWDNGDCVSLGDMRKAFDSTENRASSRPPKAVTLFALPFKFPSRRSQ